MEFRYVICDVFTDRPLAGNQLAVFTDARLVPEHLLQPIAREMNFSETVFVYPAAAGGHAKIRIFTPFNELPFAGHPVLGRPFVLAAPPLAPDLAALARATPAGVSCFAGSGVRWKTRMFAPGHGIAEDPATGSAAGPLACHLVRHGLIQPGEEIQITQGVEMGRPSTLFARAGGTRERIESVEVGGSAVTVARGEFRLQ